ncbi:MAG: aminopeptidase P family protein [Deltaproteobacteria bacterium]|nr:aminopeptidase P family protein [Deltaproteobacteria bacterium]
MNINTFIERRRTLRKNLTDGVILFVGQGEASRNYPANPYPFRQDSHFLYYIGTNLADLAAVILPGGEEILFGPAEDPDDLVWHGPHPVLADHAREAGIKRTEEIGKLGEILKSFSDKGETIHYLPPYRGDRTLYLADLFDMPVGNIASGASKALARQIVEQRSIKSADEVAEIENALKVSAEMYDVALKMIAPGKTEAEVAGAMQGVALKYDRAQSFPPIVSIRGEVLHNTSYANTMGEGDLLLIDSGTESPRFYASDITRTLPVSGRFTEKQKAVYQVVLNAQLAAIEAGSPALSNRDLHLISARTIAAGLKDIGLMKGDPEEAVANGAHALFFCHGLGHMLGIDVHDMEDLGDVVGYPEGTPRSKQFGLAFLRLAKQLKPGFVLTFEPGIYFVPALIDRWRSEKKHEAFIDYAALENYRTFGGIRIEDDILITDDGCRVLGDGIPKTIEDVEAAMAR